MVNNKWSKNEEIRVKRDEKGEEEKRGKKEENEEKEGEEEYDNHEQNDKDCDRMEAE